MPDSSTLNPPSVPPDRRAYAALPLLWTAVVLVLTLTPAIDMPRTPAWKLLSFDTAAHAGVFGVLAALSGFSLRRQRRWPRLARHSGLVALLGSTALGGLIEVLQYAMHLGRHAEWTDWLSDTLGAALAVGLLFLVRRVWQARRPATAALELLMVAASLGAAPVQAQDLGRARETINWLASPELQGRGYVYNGDHKAAAYLAGRLSELGLTPLAPAFIQPFAVDVNTFPGEMKLVLGTAAKGRAAKSLVVGRDFIAAPDSRAGSVSGAKLLALDSLVFTDLTAVERFLKIPLDARVLLLQGREARRLDKLPASLRQHLDKAAAWITLVPKLTASLADSQAPQPRLEVLASAWRFSAAAQADLGVQIKLDAQLKRNYPTQNVAAVVRGSAQPDSFLVVSAHYDHLGTMGRKAYFPGANDNASGVALLLELAAHYARPENRPAYSVVFLLFGAEEAGLRGSRYFVAHPLVPLDRIRFLVNLDLLGTGEQGATVVNGRVLDAPYQRLVALNAAHRYLPQLAPRGPAANSDHFPFSEVGVPAFFIYTRGGSPAYHDVHDRPEALSLAGFAGAFGLVRDFVNELGAAKK